MKRYEENPMKARVQKLNNQNQGGIKVLFKIEIQNVIVTDDSKNTKADISVCFEQSHKLAISSEKHLNMVQGQPVTIEFKENVSLVTTLYKDGDTGNYKEKLGKLIVRKSKENAYGGTGYKGLGLASLPLHRLVADFQSQQFNIPLINNSDAVGRIDVIISSKFIGEVSRAVVVVVVVAVVQY